MGTGGGNVPYVQHLHGGSGTEHSKEVAYTLNCTGVMGVVFSYVRRLLPVEAEVLMGFPKLWTRISWLGKPESECPKAPRYKCCGNSMGVNVMEWLGIKINEYLEEKYNYDGKTDYRL
jgi:site-specific DNA-cytosine methylase